MAKTLADWKSFSDFKAGVGQVVLMAYEDSDTPYGRLFPLIRRVIWLPEGEDFKPDQVLECDNLTQELDTLEKCIVPLKGNEMFATFVTPKLKRVSPKKE